MYDKLVIYFLRKKFGLKNGEAFRFAEQRSKENYYFFDKDRIMKVDRDNEHIRPSSVKLNWLLDKRCHIKKAGFNVY